MGNSEKEGKAREDLAVSAFQVDSDVKLVEMKSKMAQRINPKINEACERKQTKTKDCRLIQGTMHHHSLTEQSPMMRIRS